MDTALPANAHSHHSPAQRAGFLETIAVFPAACATLIFLASFWNAVNINYGNQTGAEQVGLDLQVAIKLVIAALAAAIGFWGLIQSPRVRRILTGLPGIVLVLLAIVFLVTSAYALPQVAYVCRAAALINIAYLVLIPTALVTIGLRGVIFAALVGMTVNLVANWCVYLFVPSTGIFVEEFSHDVLIHRMGGLGHPNSIGRMAALTILIALAMLRCDKLAPRWPGSRAVLVAIITLAIIISAATISRTSIAAGVAAIVLLMADQLLTRRGVLVVVCGFLMVVIGFFTAELVTGGEVFGKHLVSTLTKTGELEELTSATGRTGIWVEAVRFIAERPLTGWGINSAPILLDDYAGSTHNLLLHVTFSGGIIAGLLLVVLLLWSLLFGLTSETPIIRAISMYVLVSGIFEDTCFDTFASPCMLLWVTAMLYPSFLASFGPLRSAIEKKSISPYHEGWSSA